MLCFFLLQLIEEPTTGHLVHIFHKFPKIYKFIDFYIIYNYLGCLAVCGSKNRLEWLKIINEIY